MFPVGKIAELLLRELPERTVTATDAAFAARPSWTRISGGAAPVDVTVVDPSNTNEMLGGGLMVFEADNVANPVQVKYNDATGLQTQALAAVGAVLILVGNKNGKWKKVA
jgi:hypothetical protein